MSEAANLISAGAKEIINQAQALGLTWNLRQATVVSSSVTNGLVVIFDGDTVPIAAVNMSGSWAFPTNRVYCLMIPQLGNFVTGRSEPAGSIKAFNAVATVGGTSSGSYSNMPGSPSVSITKSASTSLLASLQISAYSSSAVNGAELAVSVNSSDYQLCRIGFNIVNNHTTLGGQRIITGIPAGSFTVTARWRVLVGGTVAQDANDWVSLVVTDFAA